MSRTTLAVGESIFEEHLLPLVRMLMPAGADIILHYVREHLRPIMSDVTRVLYEVEQNNVWVILHSGLLLEVKMHTLDEIDIPVEAERRSSPFHALLKKSVCFRKRLNRNY